MSRRAALVLAVIVAVLAVGATMIWKPWVTEVPEGAAFVMGEEVVTEEELEDRNESLRALYGVQAPSDPEDLAGFREQSAKSMAISMVLDRAIEEHEVQVPQARVDAALREFVRTSFGGNRQGFVTALGNVGTSEDSVRKEIRRQLQLRRLPEKVVGTVEVSRAELRSAFSERRDELATPERRTVNNVVVRSRSEAFVVHDELRDGADITDVARRHSIDASTRQRGGALGPVTRDQLLPPVGEAVFATPPGDVYGPVEGDQGWNIGLVTGVRAERPARFAQVAKDLRASLETEKAHEKWSRWLEARLREADIEYAAGYLPDDPYAITSWADVAPEVARSPER